MRKGIIFALLFTAPVMVQAGVYTCEVNGRKVYQSTPCNVGDKPLSIDKPVGVTAPHSSNDRSSSEEIRRELEEKRARSQEIVEQRAEEARKKIEIKRAIRGRRVVVGMTSDQVISSWGRPERTSTSMESGFAMEHWIYPGRHSQRHVYFKNGEVVSFTD